MSRIEKLRKSVSELYAARNEGRAVWSDWLYANHVFIVADYADKLADRFGARKELAMAAGILHDIADSVTSRKDPRHEEESLKMARTLSRDAGFSDEEIHTIVDDAVRKHGCHKGNLPTTLEGKVMATADALAHFQTDFYDYAVQVLRAEMTNEEIVRWALPKLERDFNDKIFFPDVREEVRSDYERLRRFFSEGFC
jgi:putative nucleotidyltransferase with HDIG domain